MSPLYSSEMVSRRQLAISGTTISSSMCNSGLNGITPPPGMPLPRPNECFGVFDTDDRTRPGMAPDMCWPSVQPTGNRSSKNEGRSIQNVQIGCLPGCPLNALRSAHFFAK